jgi:transcriptional regulator with XRE-family HTH domain
MEETFGQKLRALRRTKGITQRELAKRVGIDFSYISKLENDRLPPPAADTVVKICKVLSVAPDELLAATGKIPSQIQQSIGFSPAAIQFLRSAQAMELSEAEWRRLSEQLKRLRE